MADWPGKTLCIFLSASLFFLFLSFFPPSPLSHFLSHPLVSDVCLWPVVFSVRITIKQGLSVAEGRRSALTCWVRPQYPEQHIVTNLVPLLIYPPPTRTQTDTHALSSCHEEATVFTQNCASGIFLEMTSLFLMSGEKDSPNLCVCECVYMCVCVRERYVGEFWLNGGPLAEQRCLSPWSQTSGDQPGM